jgi:putative serine protease PepD
MDESESAAEEVARRRGQRRRDDAPSDERPPAPEHDPRRRRTAAEVMAPLLAAWRALAANAARWPGAARSRLASISPRQVGLTLLATVAGAAVALGAAALAGGSSSSSTTSATTTSGPAPGWLGVQTTTSTTSIPGATVEVIEPGGPAQKAGLTSGDVITQVNGQPITSSGGLATSLASMQPGEQVQLQVNRLGQVIVIDTTLASRPPGVP